MNGPPEPRGRTPLNVVAAVLTGALLVLGVSALPASAAQEAATVTFTGSLDDRALTSIDANAPALLEPDEGTVLSIDVRNQGEEDVEVRSIRLSGSVLGLSFLNYTTRVDLLVGPGETGSRTFELDLGDLGGQARGLLPGSIELLGPDRQVLAERDVALDVNGDVRSVYGVFGLGIGAITALLFLMLVVQLGAGRLPVNRWSRAMRFVVPGVGLGLTVSVTLSVLRLLMPSRTASLVLVAIGALIGLAVGYLTPAPDDGTGREDLYEEDFAPVPAVAGKHAADRGLGGPGASPPEQPARGSRAAGPAEATLAPGAQQRSAAPTRVPGPDGRSMQ